MNDLLTKFFSEGVYCGQIVSALNTDIISVREVDYVANRADWHYHENAFFCYVIKGEYAEGTLKKLYRCSKGDVFFQQWDEKHYNTSTAAHTCLYVELKQDWLKANSITTSSLTGHFHLEHPAVKTLFQRIRFESLQRDNTMPLVIDELIMEVFGYLKPASISRKETPTWISRIQQMLHDLPDEKWSLAMLAKEADVHPNHLCRYFKVHFHCTLSSYIRKLKTERAFDLLNDTDHSVTSIGYLSGFSDQSHFIRCFKETYAVSPAQFKKTIRSAKR